MGRILLKVLIVALSLVILGEAVFIWLFLRTPPSLLPTAGLTKKEVQEVKQATAVLAGQVVEAGKVTDKPGIEYRVKLIHAASGEDYTLNFTPDHLSKMEVWKQDTNQQKNKAQITDITAGNTIEVRIKYDKTENMGDENHVVKIEITIYNQ